MAQHTTRVIPIASFCLIALLCAADARAQMFVPNGKDTLRELPGVEVLVEPLEPGLTPSGINAGTIAAEVTRQLRASGITVYPNQMQNPSPAKAYLYVQVSGFALQRQGYVIAVQTHLRQSVRSLATESTIVNAMTWDQAIVWLAPTASPAEAVRRQIQLHVEQFIRDWTAMR
jgi:hypothetical protein